MRILYSLLWIFFSFCLSRFCVEIRCCWQQYSILLNVYWYLLLSFYLYETKSVSHFLNEQITSKICANLQSRSVRMWWESEKKKHKRLISWEKEQHNILFLCFFFNFHWRINANLFGRILLQSNPTPPLHFHHGGAIIPHQLNSTIILIQVNYVFFSVYSTTFQVSTTNCIYNTTHLLHFNWLKSFWLIQFTEHGTKINCAIPIKFHVYRIQIRVIEAKNFINRSWITKSYGRNGS